MTIREKFAKYTTEEIRNGIAKLEAKANEEYEAMKHYKSIRDVEMFRVSEDLWEEYCEKLMDAKCALSARLGGSVPAIDEEE